MTLTRPLRWPRALPCVLLMLGGCVSAVSPAREEDCPEPAALPETWSARAAELLELTRPHGEHLWRDTPPLQGELLVGFVEIPRGSREKWEFDIAQNDRVLDRMLDPSVGGYPVNYGFVPRTLAADGDPLDVLVLGPTLAGGTRVLGRIVGVMYMDDEKGRDPKLVIRDPRSTEAGVISDDDRARIGAFFDAYKKPDAASGKWSRVTGWGNACEAGKLLEAMRLRDLEPSAKGALDAKRLTLRAGIQGLTG